MQIVIDNPGAWTTVQDAGRFGCQQYGIRTSGVMDQDAYRAVNSILGNDPDAAVLEMTLTGLQCHFEGDGLIALTGADMNALLDGEPVERYAAVPVHDGQQLRLSLAEDGCRAYLGAAGGLDVPLVLGSRSTDVKSHLGGYEGRTLKTGDRLATGRQRLTDDRTSEAGGIDVPRERSAEMGGDKGAGRGSAAAGQEHRHLPHYGHAVSVHVVEGPQADWFGEEARKSFFDSTYSVAPASDRMGIRLSGTPVESLHGVDIVSDGIAAGSIQIPKNGMPIIMMADHQTTGGYAKIGTVCSFDLPRLAQVKPGDQVSFRRVSVDEAQKMLLDPAERERSAPLGFHLRAAGTVTASVRGWHRSRQKLRFRRGWRKR